MANGFDMHRFNRFINRMKSRKGLRSVYKQWGVRYLAWIKRGFVVKSRGGTFKGVKWAKLKPATIKARASRRKTARARTAAVGKHSILIDRLASIRKALTPGAPGSLWRWLHNGVRVGFGGPAKHPDGKATIRDIAVFHDQGEGRLPRRQILHKPDRAFRKMMLETLGKGIDRLGR